MIKNRIETGFQPQPHPWPFLGFGSGFLSLRVYFISCSSAIRIM